MVVALCGSKCLPAPFSSFVLPQDIYEARGADIWFGSPGRTLARLSLSFSRKNEAHFFSSSLQLFAASHHAFPNELVHTRPFIVCRLTSPTSLFCVIIKHGLEPARQSAFRNARWRHSQFQVQVPPRCCRLRGQACPHNP